MGKVGIIKCHPFFKGIKLDANVGSNFVLDFPYK